MPQLPILFIIAGEASGDALGATLLRALRAEGASWQFEGVGGPAMAAEGCKILFSYHDIALLGLTEVMRHIGRVFRRVREVCRAIETQRPVAILTIDAPGFSFWVARKIKKLGIPIIHYVAPTVWAWRPGRARKMAQRFDAVLTLFPFEPPYFEAVGLPAYFVGHPLVAHLPTALSLPDSRTLLVLPGSRKSEIQRLMPVFLETLNRLHQRFPEMQVVIPLVPGVAKEIQDAWTAYAGHHALPVVTWAQQGTEKEAAFRGAKVALAASGTVALELAAYHVPMVIAYKLSALSAFLARWLLKTPYVCMVNILLQRKVIPELLQDACTPEGLTAVLGDLWTSLPARAAQQKAESEAIALLKPAEGAPAEIAARRILALVKKQK